MLAKKDKERSRLLAAWQGLGEADRGTLVQFAEFLRSRQTEAPEPVSQEPIMIPAPENESVVMALKRLKKSYPMIDADMGLLDAASRLLMEKVTGAPEAEIIAKMEALFAQRYQGWLAEKAQEPELPIGP